MITPTVGRVLLFFPQFGDQIPHDHEVPLNAHIAYINENGTLNLTVSDKYGVSHGRQSVFLRQDGDVVAEHMAYAEWMPYQVQVAKTHDTLNIDFEDRVKMVLVRLGVEYLETQPDNTPDTPFDTAVKAALDFLEPIEPAPTLKLVPVGAAPLPDTPYHGDEAA